MKLICTQHPNLFLPKHGVQFTGGEAEVPDAKAKAILKESPHIYVEEPAPQSPARRQR
jgi:hypothetical protein